jgi:hypothetical protein
MNILFNKVRDVYYDRMTYCMDVIRLKKCEPINKKFGGVHLYSFSGTPTSKDV